MNQLDPSLTGVYSFWSGRICIYVGKASEQSIRTRLLQHYNKCHNTWLDLWLKSGHKIKFRYKSIDDAYGIGMNERVFISKYRPQTNIIKPNY